jgi:hypothetical protein
MRTASVSLVQFLVGWILSVAVGAVAVLVLGLPGLLVLVGLMIGAHYFLNRRAGVGPAAGPQLPGKAEGD